MKLAVRLSSRLLSIADLHLQTVALADREQSLCICGFQRLHVDYTISKAVFLSKTSERSFSKSLNAVALERVLGQPTC